MLFAIRAYENYYGGLHGMEDKFIVKCDNFSEANEVATEASFEVMDSYECIMDDLEESAQHSEMDIDELRAENVAYEIYQLNSDATQLCAAELDDLVYNNFDDLVEKYGVKEV